MEEKCLKDHVNAVEKHISQMEDGRNIAINVITYLDILQGLKGRLGDLCFISAIVTFVSIHLNQ